MRVGCSQDLEHTGIKRGTAVCEHSGSTECPHSSGWSPNAALWAEMRYPVHGRPPTLAEHRNGVNVGVLIRPIAAPGLGSRVPKSLTVQRFLAEREGFEPSIRVTPDTTFPVRVRAVPGRPRWSIPNSLAARLTRSSPPESRLVRPRRGHGRGQKIPDLTATPAPRP
jgi:hypothetical protein